MLLDSWFLPALVSPVIGSFLGVLARRLPYQQKIAWDRSRCDSCHHLLQPLDLVPIFSFVALRARCRYCGAAIPWGHLGLELAALAVALWAASLDGGIRLWADCVLGWVLLTLAWIDAEHMLLPNLLTWPLVALGLVWAVIATPETMLDDVIGAAVGYLLFRGIAWLYRRLRGHDGLGEGDASLLAAAGAWVGWQQLGAVVLLAALSGICVALIQSARGRSLRADTAIPFGPCLALGTWIVFLYLT
jgi:leader peptidase (prepilin peptidase)/N-methyltransferase